MSEPGVATDCDECHGDCDECHGDIAYHETAYLVPTGEELDGCPVVRLLCATCYGVAAITLPTESTPLAQDGLPECITQDPRHLATAAYREACAKWATEIADSVHCPPECGGHPICKPCLALAVERGLVVWRGSL